MRLSLLFGLNGCFFIFTALFTALHASLRNLSSKEIETKIFNNGLIATPLRLFFNKEEEKEALFFSVVLALHLTRFAFAAISMLTLLELKSAYPEILSKSFTWIGVSMFLLLAFCFGDYIPRLMGSRRPSEAAKLSTTFVFPLLYIAYLLSYPCLKLSHWLFQSSYTDHSQEPETQAKQELIDIIKEAELKPSITMHEKKLIESVVHFHERYAREIMVPRIDIFGLPASTSIREAAKLIEEEGYSRIPIYENTIDEIVGVVMYKDIISIFRQMEASSDPKLLDKPIKTLKKNPFYTPETKKISNLLLDFRKKQVHIAIVVDEYGGTEGIVTIEDILEEIVGEIADEYDIDEKELFTLESDGSWIIDAKMSINDIDQELGIKIPQEGDFDTIGGYIFHCTGSIPAKGFAIHKEEFELEVLESNDRCVEKVRLKSVNEPQDKEESA